MPDNNVPISPNDLNNFLDNKKELVANENKEFGVRFTMFNNKGKLVKKEKWFKTQKAMEAYLDKISDEGNLYSIDSYSK